MPVTRSAAFGMTALVFMISVLLAPGPAFAETKPLVLGIHPYLAPSALVKKFTPLAEYLSKKIGIPVAIDIAPDYESQIQRVGDGRIDFAYMGPASYVTMVDRYGRVPLLSVVEADYSTSYYGVIAVAESSPLRSIEDLRNKSFAFGDPNSTMSSMVPRAMLLRAGIELKDLGRYSFIPNHENVAMGVLAGDFDAGAVKRETFLKYKGQGLRALAVTELFTEHIFVARKDLPSDVIDKLRAAMYSLKSMGNEGRAILTSINPEATGLVEARDSDYNNLRAVIRALGAQKEERR